MSWRGRRHLARWVLAGALALTAAGVLIAMRGRVERYTPGETTEGVTSVLARGLPDEVPDVRFTDATAEAGLVFRHFPAGPRAGKLPEDMGSGVALGDVDSDGWTDVFLVNAGGALAGMEQAWGDADARSRLFRNQGGARFADVTEESGIELEVMGMGAAFLDADSDGDLDLLATSYPELHFFANETRAPGAPRFYPACAVSGMKGLRGFWTGIACGDPDKDGDVDAYVCGYVRYEEQKVGKSFASQYGRDIPALLNPSSFQPERNLYLRNQGDATFEEVAGELGIANETGRSLAAVFADLSADGWPDVYVANDVSDNAFFLNRGDGSFVDRTAQALLGDYRGAMGLAVADFDADLDLDVFVTHWVAQENALYVAEPPLEHDGVEDGKRTMMFFDQADKHGLGQPTLDKVGWGTRFLDVDGDGRLDVLAINGGTIPERDDPARLEPMRSQVFWHGSTRDGFYELGEHAGPFFAGTHVARGGATFDPDLDGDDDLVVVRHGAEAAFLRNERGQESSWLRLRLRQSSGNTFALGARVLVTAGGATRMDELGTDGSYLSQHAVGELAFGLGRAGSVEKVEVVWPDGTRESAGPFPADTLVTWVRGQTPRSEPLPGKGQPADRKPAPDVQRRFYAVRDQAATARLAGDHARAAELYRSALELWPAHADCLYYLANSLTALGREREALAMLEELVRFQPMQSGGWVQLGRLRLPGGDPSLDDLDLAQQAFERAHRLNEEESGPVVRLGEVALLRGRLDEAARLLADAAAMNPKSAEALYLGGKAAWLAGRPARAADLLERATAVARAGSAGKSNQHEGNTRTGNALVEQSLEPWLTLATRETDAEREYGSQ